MRRGFMAAATVVVAASSVLAQNTLNVKGTVTDTKGEPLIGVNVRVKGTAQGVATDLDGKFSITGVARNASLEFSYVGMQSQTVALNGQSTLKVVLKDDANQLADVVVVGYGVVKKADLAGSVSVVDNKSFKDQPITQVSQALQGRVSGVHVESSGAPGGSVKIRVRGSNSINKSNDPLYVIDGVVRESGLDGINSEDIQSMQVLKDASSTAIYGARGSNGVVLITTKKGKAGHREITFDASLGTSSVYKRYDLLSGAEYAAARGITANAVTDWQDEIFRTGLTQNYKLSVSNGNENTQYYLSGNFMNQTGIVLNTENTRYQVKGNINSKLFSWLNLTADISLAQVKSHSNFFGLDMDNVINRAISYSPAMAVVNEDGTYPKDPHNNPTAFNPVGSLLLQGTDNITNMLNGRIDLQFKLAKGLTFTTTNGIDYNDARVYGFATKRVNTSNSMSNGNAYRRMLQSSNNLTYMNEWGKHSLTATGVFEATTAETRTIGITGNTLLTESVGYWNVGVAANKDASNGFSDWSLLSYVGRVVYNYDNRYLFTGTFRADGSSRFLGNKWGYFPSLAVAWSLSNEKFMKDFKAIEDIKIRASYGVVGNQAISPYSTLGLMTAAYYGFGNATKIAGYFAQDTPDRNLTWEKTSQFDLGLEFSLFNRRLTVGVDYFDKRTTDALILKTRPNYRGGGSFWVNDGEIANKGIDLNLTARILQGKDVQWTSTINATYLKNEVVSLAGSKDITYEGPRFNTNLLDAAATIIKPGESIGTFWGYQWTGLNAKGDDTYADLNGDGKVDGNDRMAIGKATPDFTLGWNNSISYKNWDLNVFINSSFGADRLNASRFFIATPKLNSFVTLAEAYNNGFDKVGAGTEYASLTSSTADHKGVSSKWVERADYIRMENISLSYNLSRAVTKFADIRFTLSAQNLFTISSYKGLDPAGSSFSSENVDVNAGVDMGAYPLPRTFTFGVRMTF